MTELMCSCVLFDLDGVLADSTAAVERHWRLFALRWDLAPDDVLSAAHGRRSVDVIGDLVPRELVGSEAAWFENIEVEDTTDVVALPGGVSLLENLPVDRWGVVTSCGRRLAAARLAAAGLAIPAMLVSGDSVVAGKPDPEGYRQGITALRATPAETVVFEDAPSGIEAGRRSGATVVAVLTTHTADQLHAHHIVSDLSNVEIVASGQSLHLRLT